MTTRDTSSVWPPGGGAMARLIHEHDWTATRLGPPAGWSERLKGAVEAMLARKWARELDYRLVKELWTFGGNRIAVRFAYEYRDDSGQWFRAYGNENWEFDEEGLMQRRIASINEHPIRSEDRRLHWPLGRRPDDHPGLTELGF